MAQQDKSNSAMTEEMYLMLGIALLVVALWWMLHTPITYFFYGIWWLEMQVIQLFTPDLAPIEAWMANSKPALVSFEQFCAISTQVGQYSRWFWFPVMIGAGIWVFFSDPLPKLRKVHSSDSLVKTMAQIWPHAAIGYSKKIDKLGTMGRGMESGLKPREFAKMLKLLDEDGDLIESEAEAVFIKQIGPQFNGVKEWKRPGQEYKIALAALFFLKFDRRNDDFVLLRNRLAEEFNESKTIAKSHEAALKVVEQYEDSKFMHKLSRLHAYEYTLLYSMFKHSKRGVFAPCEFRWVKHFNRTLWYGLNSVERRTPWVEAAGIKAQWLAEVASKKAIKTPIVGEAVVGLKEALSEIVEPNGEDSWN